MLRSRSEGHLGPLALAGGFKHGMIANTTPGAQKISTIESVNMRSYAVIKALPNEGKFMHVELSANDGILCISMLQKQDNVLQTFTLVRLAIKKLLVCMESSSNDVFVVCMDVGGKIEGDIWCYTSPLVRNRWLTTLQKNGARLAYVKKHADKFNIHNYLHMTLHGGMTSSERTHAKAQGDHVNVQKVENSFCVYTCVLIICAVVAEMWMQGAWIACDCGTG